MRLIRLIRQEIPQNLRSLAIMTALSALSTSMLLWVVDLAAKDAAKGQLSVRLLVLFAITITLFGVTHNYVLVTASQDVEGLIHRLRVRLFDAVRRADLVTVERVGRAALHGALTQDTQTLARTLPMLVIGGQQATMLVFLALYLAWLSPLACVMAFGFAGFSVALRFSRMAALGPQMRAAMGAEMAVFDGLTDLLRGFKEVRMSVRRADGVVEDAARASDSARRINTAMKAQWGQEFALLQALFYVLVGLMVFVVPLFTTKYYEVVVPATMAALFIVGPVGTLAHVTPLVTQTEFALANIESMAALLSTAAGDAPDEHARALDRPPSRIALRDAVFSYTDAAGNPVFSVGPLSAEFHAGEITFVTGGNGSGKSTMLRLLTGLMPIKGGALLADGEPVEPERMQSYRDQISAIFSDYHLSRRLYGVADPDPARARALLERLEMQDKASVQNGAFSTVALSTGQRKRLALVLAQMEDKPVIVLDEWAADQDPHFRRVFYEELLPEMKAKGKIVICVTHDDRWFGMADRVYHMNEGRIEVGRIGPAEGGRA